ncbi:hypothetical protein HMPREF0648_0546 [Prevotella bivia JCVIHMP010]|nr:hypothetical protein HMPREF0648_0546 [Prevotella bivia JCVIHMP010]KXU57280.1 hypothetical protein HMPREF3218_0201520 [Prevotella bivia]
MVAITFFVSLQCEIIGKAFDNLSADDHNRRKRKIKSRRL